MAARQPFTRRRRTAGRISWTRRGFTILEMVTAAAIVLILSLILIPILRGRVEEARITAAQADMKTIEAAEVIAFGFTGHYFRLNDLIRPKINTEGLDAAQRTTERRKLPQAFWNEPFLPEADPLGKQRRDQLETSWTGPYMSMTRSATLEDLVIAMPKLFRSDGATWTTSSTPPITITIDGQGPILLLKADCEAPPSVYGLDKIEYPVDPWGNPYIFFGTGKIGNNPLTIIVDADQVDYATAVVYCLGPNGLPGNKTNPQPADYFRDLPAGQTPPPPLGQGDDLKREF